MNVKEQIDNQQIEQPISTIIQQPIVESEFRQQYKNILKINKNQQTTIYQKIKACLPKYKIIFDQTNYEEFSFQVSKWTNNFQIMTLIIKYGCFTFEVQLINFESQSSNHKIQQFYKGSFATVYRAEFLKNEIAIKCHTFNQSTFQNIFVNTLKEYCMMKIASVLQVGAYNSLKFQFDILIFKNCIEFSMEFCPSQDKNKNQSLSCINLKRDLIEGLRILHLIKIIHFDIKPENIGYSRHFKKFVFLDLGLSKIIKESQGNKTLTKFRGSLYFCSNQMQNCYISGKASYIDLYYNDAIGLIKSYQFFKENVQIFSFSQNLFLFSLSSNFLFVVLKYYCYKYMLQQIWVFFSTYQYPISIKKKMVTELILIFGKTYLLRQLNQTISSTFQTQQLTPQFNWNCDIQSQKNDKQNQNNKYKAGSFYFTRIQEIKSMKQYTIHQQKNQFYYTQLFDLNAVRKLSITNYYIELSYFMQINTKYIQFHQKIKAAQIFLQFNNKTVSNDKLNLQLIKMCITDLFDYSTTQPLSSEKIKILSNTILSIFLLQLKTGSQLLLTLTCVLDSQNIETINKLQIAIKYILSLFWNYYKYKTRYDSQQLTQQIYEIIGLSFLIFVQREPQNRLINLFSQIINFYISSTGKHYNTPSFCLKQIKKWQIQFKIYSFYDQLRYVVLLSPYRQLRSLQLKNGIYFDQQLRQLIQQQLTKQKNRFIIIHFVIAKKNPFNNTANVVELFQQIFKPYDIPFHLQIQLYMQKIKETKIEKLNLFNKFVNPVYSTLKIRLFYINEVLRNYFNFHSLQQKRQVLQYLYNTFGQFMASTYNLKSCKYQKLDRHQLQMIYFKICMILLEMLNQQIIMPQQVINIHNHILYQIKSIKCIHCKIQINIELLKLRSLIARLDQDYQMHLSIQAQIISKLLNQSRSQVIMNRLDIIYHFTNLKQNKNKVLINPFQFVVDNCINIPHFVYEQKICKIQIIKDTYPFLYQNLQLDALVMFIQKMIISLQYKPDRFFIDSLIELFKTGIIKSFTSQNQIIEQKGRFIQTHQWIINKIIIMKSPYTIIYLLTFLDITNNFIQAERILQRISKKINSVDWETKNILMPLYIRIVLFECKFKKRKEQFIKRKYKYEWSTCQSQTLKKYKKQNPFHFIVFINLLQKTIGKIIVKQ